MTEPSSGVSFACPVVPDTRSRVLLAHGGGGRQMAWLLNELVLPILGPPSPGQRRDAALLSPPAGRIAVTTDSYVVKPLVFPGGDIGRLAVFGTVNDLATAGARPLWMSVGLILEEGLALEALEQILHSLRASADLAGIEIVTGDTKVVERGRGDGLYLNTTAVGTVEHALPLAPLAVRPGDVILVTGDIGRHGMAIMSVREGLEFESEIESDAAPLADLVLGLLAAGITPSCLRDPTRGGLGAVLTEIAFDAGITLRVAEAAVPVRQDVQAACEILGLDPLFVACEGRMVLFVPPGQADEALGLLRRHPAGCGAAKIGEVLPGSGAQVLLESRIGVLRRLQLPSGEQLPRIC